MRFACLFAAVAVAATGCSSAPKSDTTTTTSTSTTTEPTPTTTTAAATTASQPASTTTVTTTTTPASQPVTQPSQTGTAVKPAGGKATYSCFSYIAANTTAKRHNCVRTADCPEYIEQVKNLKGIRDLTGCASVPSVWCFHQVVKNDPEGVNVCQPTVDDCKAARAAAVKAKESVDTDCAQDS